MVKGRKLAAPVLFATICLITFSVYQLGVPGGFLFDDTPNLELLGHHGGVHDIETLRLYLSESTSGPTGRPLAMLSFLIDAQDWPADPEHFKHTSIVLHIINGILLFVALFMATLQSRLHPKKSTALWIATIAATWWILNPYHVSTVLYIIQRMTVISTCFVLIGIIAYLYGRKQLIQSPQIGYFIITLAVVLATLTASLAKENGAILPLLLLVLEFSLLTSSADHPRPTQWWLWLFLALPSIGIIAILLYYGIGPGNEAYSYRAFTPTERLLTESRILFEYLWQLLLPHPGTLGMFRDHITISHSVLQPPATLAALMGLTALTTIAITARKHLPLLSTAILFFLAGHLIESTLLGLELVFEHRNYLPSLFLYLPLAQLIVWFYQRHSRYAIALSISLALLSAINLGLRANLWSDTNTLYMTWAGLNPQSTRAQIVYSTALEHRGHPQQALSVLTEARNHTNNPLLLDLHRLRLQAKTNGHFNPSLFANVRNNIKTAPPASEDIVALKAITNDFISGRETADNGIQILQLWHSVAANRSFRQLMGTQIHHQMGSLLLHAGQIEKAIEQFRQSLRLSRQTSTGLRQAALLASQHEYCAALSHLRLTAALSDDNSNTINAEYYHSELQTLRKTISNDAQQEQANCNDESSTEFTP